MQDDIRRLIEQQSLRRSSCSQTEVVEAEEEDRGPQEWSQSSNISKGSSEDASQQQGSGPLSRLWDRHGAEDSPHRSEEQAHTRRGACDEMERARSEGASAETDTSHVTAERGAEQLSPESGREKVIEARCLWAADESQDSMDQARGRKAKECARPEDVKRWAPDCQARATRDLRC